MSRMPLRQTVFITRTISGELTAGRADNFCWRSLQKAALLERQQTAREAEASILEGPPVTSTTPTPS